MFAGSASCPISAIVRTCCGVNLARMRAIHAASRSVMRPNAGFGYSFFHRSGSKSWTLKYPNVSWPGAFWTPSQTWLAAPSVPKSVAMSSQSRTYE